jgi:hypothetical protein
MTPDDVVNYHFENETELGRSITEFLAEKQIQLEAAIVDREKLIKTRKIKADENLINEASYKWLEPEVLQEAWMERFKHEDCNAGVIFDDLRSSYYQDEVVGVEIVMNTLST